MLKANDYKFFNLPKEYSMADYSEAIKLVIDKYSKIKSLVSIYNWGNPSVSGISDIDLLLVFKNNSSPLPLLKRSFYFLDSKTRYLATHPFIFIDEQSFRNARYIYKNTNFRLLHGKSIKIKKLSSINSHYSDAALLNDIIIRHYPRDFLEQLAGRRINARNTLLRLNSLKYSIGILEGLTKERGRWDDKLKLIENLRKNWFNENNFELLASLNEDSVKITMGIVEKFREFLIRNNLVKIRSGDCVRYNGIKNRALFVKGWSRENAMKEMSKTVKNRQKFYSVLPIELSAQLAEYSRHHGLISGYIRKNISNGIAYNLKYSKVVEKRISILNRQAELASRLRHSDFAAFFDFGYRNKSGINNWILNILDFIRF